MKSLLSLSVALMLGLTLSAQAGIKLVQSYQKIGDKAEPSANRIFIANASAI